MRVSSAFFLSPWYFLKELLILPMAAQGNRILGSVSALVSCCYLGQIGTALLCVLTSEKSMTKYKVSGWLVAVSNCWILRSFSFLV